jgi:hypothetical protein
MPTIHNDVPAKCVNCNQAFKVGEKAVLQCSKNEIPANEFGAFSSWLFEFVHLECPKKEEQA